MLKVRNQILKFYNLLKKIGSSLTLRLLSVRVKCFNRPYSIFCYVAKFKRFLFSLPHFANFGIHAFLKPFYTQSLWFTRFYAVLIFAVLITSAKTNFKIKSFFNIQLLSEEQKKYYNSHKYEEKNKLFYVTEIEWIQ